jgi:hypothetical protein
VEEKRKIIKEFPWSSYVGYIRLKSRLSFVCYSEILDMVGGGFRYRGRRKFERFTLDGILKDMNITFWKGVKGQAVLGSDDFAEWVYERFLSKKKLDRRELAGIKDLQMGPGTVEEIGRRVSQELGVEEEKLYRPRQAPQARSLLMELCRLYLTGKMSLAEIGRKLGGVSGSALSQNRKRLEVLLGKDSSLRKAFERLSKGMISKSSQ